MDISMDIHGRGTDIHGFEYGSSDQGSFMLLTFIAKK